MYNSFFYIGSLLTNYISLNFIILLRIYLDLWSIKDCLGNNFLKAYNLYIGRLDYINPASKP